MTLIIIALHLGSFDVIQTRTFYETAAACHVAIKRVRSRTHKILWKECK